MSRFQASSVSLEKFLGDRKAAKCVFCGRRPQETKDKSRLFETCAHCHAQEISALVAFAQGRIPFGDLAKVPMTAGTLLSGRTVRMLAGGVGKWSAQTDSGKLAEWMDRCVYRAWKGTVFGQFIMKLEKELRALEVEAQKAAIPPAPVVEEAPTAALEPALQADAPAPAEVGSGSGHATVEVAPLPDINALSAEELEKLTAPEPATVPAESPAAPAAEEKKTADKAVAKALRKRAKKS